MIASSTQTQRSDKISVPKTCVQSEGPAGGLNSAVLIASGSAIVMAANSEISTHCQWQRLPVTVADKLQSSFGRSLTQ